MEAEVAVRDSVPLRLGGNRQFNGSRVYNVRAIMGTIRGRQGVTA